MNVPKNVQYTAEYQWIDSVTDEDVKAIARYLYHIFVTTNMEDRKMELRDSDQLVLFTDNYNLMFLTPFSISTEFLNIVKGRTFKPIIINGFMLNCDNIDVATINNIFSVQSIVPELKLYDCSITGSQFPTFQDMSYLRVINLDCDTHFDFSNLPDLVEVSISLLNTAKISKIINLSKSVSMFRCHCTTHKWGADKLSLFGEIHLDGNYKFTSFLFMGTPIIKGEVFISSILYTSLALILKYKFLCNFKLASNARVILDVDVDGSKTHAITTELHEILSEPNIDRLEKEDLLQTVAEDHRAYLERHL